MNDPPLVPLNPSPSTPGLGGLLLPILGWNPPPRPPSLQPTWCSPAAVASSLPVLFGL